MAYAKWVVRAPGDSARALPRQGAAANLPASTVVQFSHMRPEQVLQLQRTYGNRAVGALLAALPRPAAAVQRAKVGDEIKAAFVGTAPPTGDYAPVFYGTKFFGREFEVKATFAPDRVVDGESYHTAEYRQYVKGFFWSNKTAYATHTLSEGVTLDREAYNEDGNTPNGYKPYGHRNIADNHGAYKETDEGSTYAAKDKPSTPVEKGEEVRMNLTFKGQLAETDAKSNLTGRVLDERVWTIKGKCVRNKKGVATVTGL